MNNPDDRGHNRPSQDFGRARTETSSTTPPEPVKKPDLMPRTLSAIVMLAIVGVALWFGGWAWVALVTVVALGVLWEWNGITRRFGSAPIGEILWLFFGVLYIGVAALALIYIRQIYPAWLVFVGVLAPIFAVDIGAYFVGRAIGGPKIAPKISPSKTWAGLFGGILGAFSVYLLAEYMWPEQGYFAIRSDGTFGMHSVVGAAIYGAIIAITAQLGDFFESWMKRRAGVKDSSNLIPGHGGLFDRTDGLIAVFFLLGIALGIVRVFG